MKIGPKEAQLIALRERHARGDPKPTLDDLRGLVEQAGQPKPPKQPKARVAVQPDEIEGTACPTCGGTGMAPIKPTKAMPAEPVDDPKAKRRAYMREYMRQQKLKKAKGEP